MKQPTLNIIGLLLLVLALVIISQQPTLAATLTAGNQTDLIAAINTANSSVGADTVLLTANITLTGVVDSGMGNTGLPVITSTITVNGQGHTIARAATTPNFRILRVTSAGNLTLLNLTIRNGNPGAGTNSEGGALYNGGGIVALIHTSLTANRTGTDGGAIFASGGTLNLTNSTLSTNAAAMDGGAIFAVTGAIVKITDSNITGNTGENAGGILMAGTLTIANSTFSANTARELGGAITVVNDTILNISGSTFSANTAKYGGGVFNQNSMPDISNSTLSGNRAAQDGGGVYISSGNASISSSTFSGNSARGEGGGIFVSNGIVTFMNSIIAASPSGGNCDLDVNGLITGSSSLADDATCSGFTSSVAIRLAPLTNNGDSTRTHGLNLGSIAVDRAFSSACNSVPISRLDQRGVPRGLDGNGVMNNPSAGDCDIGAFEMNGSIRTLQFVSANSLIPPGANLTVPVNLTLDTPLAAGYTPVKAYVWVSGGTASAGTDYTPIGIQTLTFNPGDQTKTITLNLLSLPVTTDRTIILSFASSNGPGISGPARFGTITSHIVTVKATIPLGAPVITYSRTRNIRLTWAGVSWATGYIIQVDDEPRFAAPRVYENSSITADTLSAAVTVPGNGTYYWRVAAKRADGTPGLFSPAQSFMVSGS
jgi:predicted outer membrane repeat protein